MCISPAMMMMGGQVAGGLSEMLYRDTQATQMKADAAASRDVAKQQAKGILKASERQRGAARAATAASGARIDAFSLANEQEIVAGGETDAAMAILSGDRRARTMETGAKLQKAAGYNALGESLFKASGVGNWKGAKGRPFYDGTSGDYSGSD